MSSWVKHIFVSITVMTFCLPVLGQSNRQRAPLAGLGVREAAENVIEHLKLRSDSVIVDIGAGDGWWAAQMAAKLGPDGVVHAGEVDQRKVDEMKRKWADVAQIRPYLCPTDGTGLEADSCDVAFLSKTYHHLNKDSHVDYLKHLAEVIKPNGRLVIIEQHQALTRGRSGAHAWLPGLLGMQAEQAGWMFVTCEMLPKSDHYIAVFVRPEAFAEQLAGQRSSQ